MSAPGDNGKKRPASSFPAEEERQTKQLKLSARVAPSEDADHDVEMKPATNGESAASSSSSSSAVAPSSTVTRPAPAPVVAEDEEEESKSNAASDSETEDEDDGEAALQPTAERAKVLIEELINNLNDQELAASGLDVTQVRRMLKQLMDDRKKQKYLVGFVADTGVGKSFLINLILLLTEQPQATYESRRARVRGSQLEYRNHSDYERQRTKVTEKTLKRLEPNSTKHSQLRELLPRHRAQCEEKLFAASQKCGLQGQIKPWLLPSESNPDATTTVVVRIRFGRTYHLVIEYADEQQLQETAFRYVELARQAHLDNERPTDEVEALRRQFEHLTGMNPRRLNFNPSGAAAANSIPAPTSASEIRLHPDVSEIAGGVSVFVGMGAGHSESLVLDRLYLQEHLYATMRDLRRSAAITHCTLYVPSTILEGGCELQDIPGTSDPFRESAIREAMTESDLLLVLLPKCISFSAGIKATLLDSGSVQRSLKERTNHVHFIYYNEKENGFGVWNREQDWVEKRRANLQTFQVETEDWLERVVHEMTLGVDGPDWEANGKLMAMVSNHTVPMYSLQPLSFVSLAFSQGANVFEQGDFHPQDTMLAFMEATNLPRLMGAIGFVQHMQAARDLRRLCQDAPIQDQPVANSTSSSSTPSSTSAVVTNQVLPAAGCVSTLLEDLTGRIKGMTRRAGEQTARIKQECSGFLGRTKAAKLRFAQLIKDAEIPTNATEPKRIECANFLSFWDAHARKESFISQALEASVAAAKKQFNENNRRLKFGNFAVCLHENGGGNIPPLRLRNLLFDDYWSNHQLDFAQLINLALDILRDHFAAEIDKSLNNVLSELFKHNSSLVSSSIIQPVVSAARSGLLQRINVLLDGFTCGPLASRLDGPRLSGAFDRACSRSLKTFLSKNYARWMRLGRTGTDSRVDVFIREMEAHIPELVANAFDDFSQDVFNRMCERLEDTLRRVYEKDGKKLPVLQAAVTALLSEVQNMPDQKDLVQAKEKLEELKSYLEQWKLDALRSAQAALDHSALESSPDVSVLQDALLQFVQRKLVDYECGKLIVPSDGKKWIPVNQLFKQARGGVTTNIVNKKYHKGVGNLLKLLVKLTQCGSQPGDQQASRLLRNGIPGLRFGRDTKFGSMVDSAGLEVADVPHDGNCLFTALEHQLHWGGNHTGMRFFPQEETEFCVPDAVTLRGMLVGVLARQNVTQELQEQFQTNYTDGEPFNNYLASMRLNGSWGGAPEIQAFADHFAVNVQVWAGNNDEPYLVCPTTARTMRDLPVINLGYVNAQGNPAGPLNHFVSLVPRLNLHNYQRQQLFWAPRTPNSKSKPSK